jgi:hypothetical protein
MNHGESGEFCGIIGGDFFWCRRLASVTRADSVSRQRRCSADHTDPFPSVNHCVLVFQYVQVAPRLQLSEDHIASILVSGSVTHFDSFHRH